MLPASVCWSRPPLTGCRTAKAAERPVATGFCQAARWSATWRKEIKTLWLSAAICYYATMLCPMLYPLYSLASRWSFIGREHEKSIEVLFTLALTDMLHLTDQFRYSEVVKLELQLQDQLPTIKALTLREHVEVLGRIQRFKIRILLVGLTAIVLNISTRMPLRGSDGLIQDGL